MSQPSDSERETMAAMSATTAVEPPDARRDRVLTAVGPGSDRRYSWRSTILAAAAAFVIVLAAVVLGFALQPERVPSTAEQVFAASDVRTASAPIPTGGAATVVYSRQKHAGVLVMNNVKPPPPGSVYQMWLLGDHGAKSAGTMDANAIAPSTTEVLPDIDNSTALAFTVEPGAGSPRPTGQAFAELPLK